MNEANDTTDNRQDDAATGDVAGSDERYDLDLILDIPLEVRAELGHVKMLVNDLLQLGQGSIVELDKPVNEVLDIYVSSKLVARGEVVVMDEKFGIRITDIISPTERIKSLA
ncbi:MAG: flagellar motor switch protein FliN [Desulfobacterales bacterium]